MAQLDTVAEYLTRARVLLQDQIVPYRYSDDELVEALNLAILEARRIRPDLFLSLDALPEYSSGATSTLVTIDQMYRSAFLYYMVGHAQLRDEEDTSDSRAAVFMNKFIAQLSTVQA